MFQVALIVPKGSKYGKNPYLKTFLEQSDLVSRFYGAWETPNLSLLTIAGLFPDYYELHFIDEDHGQEVDFREWYDLVLVTGMTQQINRAYAICREFRDRGAHTVIGGIHASIYPEEAGLHADTVLVGEAEELLPWFLEDYEKNRQQAVYRADGTIDLTRSPAPRYHLLDPALYDSFGIQTTRGCPRTCGYCTLPVIYGSQYRYKTVEQVVGEIREVKKVKRSPFVFFADDNMFIDRAHAVALLDAIAREDIVWGTQTDIAVAESPDILSRLKDAGCRWLFIGLENPGKQSLETLDRNKWKAGMSGRYEQLIETIHKAGVYIWGSFMFGTDTDDDGTFKRTLDFTMRNGIYSGSFTILTPLPGTELFRQMQREGRIVDYDWSRYTFWDVVYKPKHMSEEELAKGVAWIYDQFYSSEHTRQRMCKLKSMMKAGRAARGAGV